LDRTRKRFSSKTLATIEQEKPSKKGKQKMLDHCGKTTSPGKKATQLGAKMVRKTNKRAGAKVAKYA